VTRNYALALGEICNLAENCWKVTGEADTEAAYYNFGDIS